MRRQKESKSGAGTTARTADGAPLSSRQERFIQEYLIDANATQAATRAGYSRKTAYSQGQRLLKHVEVCARIEAVGQRLSERAEWTFQTRLEMLRDIALKARDEENHRAVIAAIAESNKMEGSYKPAPKEPAEDSYKAEVTAFMQQVVASARPLPIGAQRNGNALPSHVVPPDTPNRDKLDE